MRKVCIFLTLLLVIKFGYSQHVRNIKEGYTNLQGVIYLKNPTKSRIHYGLSVDKLHWKNKSIASFSTQEVTNSNGLWLTIKFPYTKYKPKHIEPNSTYVFEKNRLDTPWPFSLKKL